MPEIVISWQDMLKIYTVYKQTNIIKFTLPYVSWNIAV